MALRMALAGCGGMGLRHVHGMAETANTFGSLELVAVCDIHHAAAAHVAREARELFGREPVVYTDFREMLDDAAGIDTLDIVTDTRMHHEFAVGALDAGIHVFVEKPMGLTIKACMLMAEAADRSGNMLAIAENYRRDPMNRLARALMDGGAIGTPHFMVDMGLGGGDDLMHDTGWRAHRHRAGSVILERGVHNSDLVYYFMGDVETVYAVTDVFQPVRLRGLRPDGMRRFYDHRVEDEFVGMDTVVTDAEDTAFAVLRFASGASGQFSMSIASRGHSIDTSTVHGSEGVIALPPSRTGIGPKVMLPGRERAIEGADLLDMAPDWEMDDITARLWPGPRRIASYDMEFPQIDRKTIAVELQDFLQAVESGGTPEVGPEMGMKALALSYAILESGMLGAPVTIADLLDGSVSAYQAESNAAVGL
ncbi:MAG: Gfo/Idh/MocA family oxidoreductase [Chloroflexi bacterium]|nr:Gfo/Idh/MocA family oxidoreductase [Chloroflexota bacterium]MCY3938817.1 Gfo/Idh/MocA family oxidoreductase [Chloroflexota bacterium]